MSVPSVTRTSMTLIERIRKSPRDEIAWKDFVDRYGPKIYTWCLRWHLQKADAEDVTQIVLVKLAEKMRTFAYDPSKSFRAWLKTVTHHAWQDYVDSQRIGQRGSGEGEMSKLLEDQAAPDDLDKCLEEEHQRVLLEEALARVEARVDSATWDVFRSLALEEKSGKEVAGKHGLSVAAAYMRRSRVQAMVKEEITQLESGERGVSV